MFVKNSWRCRYEYVYHEAIAANFNGKGTDRMHAKEFARVRKYGLV